MKRTDFLMIIGTGSGALLTGLHLGNQVQINYDLQKVKIYDNYIKGSPFYKNNILAAQPNAGDSLRLEREASNVHDRFAVKIFKETHHLGYLPAFENIVIANLLDRGVQLTAAVSQGKDIDPDRNPFALQRALAIEVFTQLMVPISQIQQTDLTNDRADDVVDVYRGG